MRAQQDFSGKNKVITKWQKQFKTIWEQARLLIIDHYIFKEVKNIIANNPTASKVSCFHDWMGRLYASAALIGIRRLASCGSGDASLWNLLGDIKEHNELISRNRYVEHYMEFYSDEESRLSANGEFDSLCGEGADCLSKGVIKRDLTKLKKATKAIKDFANERVAHNSPQEPATTPTYGHLESAFECLERLVIKYGKLLNAAESDSLSPNWQYDWKAIFRAPWLPK